MARGWRVLDATSFHGTVSGGRGRLTLTPRDADASPQTVPTGEVALLIIGHHTAITASAMHCLRQTDIAVLAADWRGIPVLGIYPWSDHGRIAARHIAQANLSLPRKKNAWMQLVRAKVVGQAATLRPTDPSGADRLSELARSVRSGDPANVESTAARVYWHRLFHSSGRAFRRDQESPDNLNAQLNYGYMILRGYGIRAVLSAGLSPPLGLFHHQRHNYFNLVDDLIEPFRPAIDQVVVDLGPKASPSDPAIKRLLVGSASQAFTAEGHRIPTVLSDLAQQLGRYVEGDIDRLAVPVWHGRITPSEVEMADRPPESGVPWQPPW